MRTRLALLSALAASLLALGSGCDQIPKPISTDKADAATNTNAPPASTTATAQSTSTETTQTTPSASGPRQLLPDFAAIVEANGKAVVNITATKSARSTARGGQGALDESNPLYEFFRRFNIPVPEQQAPQTPSRGMGSGFIVDANGIVLTNAHVVEGADEVRVRLSDRREFKGKVVGADKATDIAVVRIEAKDLPVVRLGDPSKLRVGEWVVAIGSPFGFENSVTAGIVSATARSLPEGTYVPFIQTDAAVNPGNSGGPLFNMQGEVIGIASQIYSRTGGYMGVAFAIPIDVAANVKTQLVEHGKVERGRIGIAIQDVDQSLAQSFGLDRPQGALVASVERGGPADKAGLKTGDVIIALDGKPVERSNELPPRVANLKPGTKATFEVWRDRKKVPVTVAIAELKDDKVAQANPAANEREQVASAGKLGLALRQLNPEERRQLNGTEGLVVEEASGAAANAGIQAGDLVTAINGKPVKSIDDVRKAVPEQGKVAILIRRGEASIYVPVDIG
jgi:serine protease Do